MNGPRSSRRDVALVAAALLVPIPLLAASGLNVPLPRTVERSLASLLPGGVGETGAGLARPAATDTGLDGESLGVTAGPTGVSGISDRAAVVVAADDAPSPGVAAPRPADEGGDADGADTPTEDDTPAPGPGDTDEPAPTGDSPDAPSNDDSAPLASVVADEPATSVEVSAGEHGVAAKASVDGLAGVGVGVDASASDPGATTGSVEITTGDVAPGIVTVPPLTVSIP